MAAITPAMIENILSKPDVVNKFQRHRDGTSRLGCNEVASHSNVKYDSDSETEIETSKMSPRIENSSISWQPVPKDTLEKYRARMYKPTSRNDLMYMLGNKCRIITYDELSNFNSFSELMDPYQCCILLYPNHDDPEVGHWCCCFIMPGTNIVQYFDSYGAYIDEPVGEFNKDAVHERKRIEPKLLELLASSPYADNVWWNETIFQSEDKATTTCGLWTVVRLKNNHLTENEFATLYYDTPVKEGVLPDLLVSAVICKLFPEKC